MSPYGKSWQDASMTILTSFRSVPFANSPSVQEMASARVSTCGWKTPGKRGTADLWTSTLDWESSQGKNCMSWTREIMWSFDVFADLDIYKDGAEKVDSIFQLCAIFNSTICDSLWCPAWLPRSLTHFSRWPWVALQLCLEPSAVVKQWSPRRLRAAILEILRSRNVIQSAFRSTLMYSRLFLVKFTFKICV